MAVWELRGFGTDRRYAPDIRYRDYTTSKAEAELFNQIPKIQWTDSGHGIVFHAFPHTGRRAHRIRGIEDYVDEHMARLRGEVPSAPAARRTNYRSVLRKIHTQLNGVQWTPTTTQTIAEIVSRLGEGWEIRPPRKTYDQGATR